MNERKQRSQEKGITLIALVITVIVLLILAGITIQALTGENGILRRTTEAKERTEIAQIKENAKIDILGVKAGNNGEITLSQLKEVLKKYFNADEVDALTKEDLGTAELTTTDGKYVIKVSELLDKVSGENGNEGIDWDAILADATENPENYKHPDQSSTNGDIGIGTDGKPVNMDLWKYTIENNKAYLREDLGSGYYDSSYDNTNIVEGEIIGKVPQYIKKKGESSFAVVTEMDFTFNGCTKLTTAPEIPSSVTNMDSTFYGCTDLTTAPEIPSSVTNMRYTFYGCTSLTTAPEIPSSVINMEATFYGCTSLTTAPEIPSSVISMLSTFYKCTSLTTAPEIPSSVTNMDKTFYECTKLTTAPEIPSSVTRMNETFYRCTSLTTAPEIPSLVTNMDRTFFYCTKLTGDLIINATNLSSYNYTACLTGASTDPGTDLKLSGSCPQLSNILATKSENSNISLK